jgi:ABC-2 type transport system permease protein
MGRRAGETRKLLAFVRRDLLVALSYRAAFVGDLASICVQAIMFAFIGKLVNPAKLPSYGGHVASYLDFAMVGIIMTVLTGLLLHRVATAIRQEQMVGTLEAILSTPTRPGTIQAGLIAYDLLFTPLRMAVLLAVVALVFGLDFHANGILPATVLFAVFVPCIWGAGLLSAAGIVTFRRGSGLVGMGMGLAGLASGAFFPLALLPAWIQTIAELNPLAIGIEGVRSALLSDQGWGPIGHDVLLLAPWSVLAMLVGTYAFRAALAREQRRGTLGLY